MTRRQVAEDIAAPPTPVLLPRVVVQTIMVTIAADDPHVAAYAKARNAHPTDAGGVRLPRAEWRAIKAETGASRIMTQTRDYADRVISRVLWERDDGQLHHGGELRLHVYQSGRITDQDLGWDLTVNPGEELRGWGDQFDGPAVVVSNGVWRWFIHGWWSHSYLYFNPCAGSCGRQSVCVCGAHLQCYEPGASKLGQNCTFRVSSALSRVTSHHLSSRRSLTCRLAGVFTIKRSPAAR